MRTPTATIAPVASAEEISFPDPPRSELEQTIEELVERAQRVLRTQSRLRHLLRANRVVVERIELEEVLRRIAEAATDLVDARYGALGVIGAEGRFDRFIHVGMPDDVVARIGHIPRGVGILGAVIDEAAPIRLERMGDDPRAVGLPAHHPPMRAFLGVPVRVREEVFGILYLTEPAAGRFTAEDEELVSVLAATAGIAIENARLFEEARDRERWSSALAEVTAALLSDGVDPLDVVIRRVTELVDATLVSVVVPDAEGFLRIAASHGTGADLARGQVFEAVDSVAGRAISEREAVSVDEIGAARHYPSEPELGPTLVVPLIASEQTIGALSVSREPGSPPFTASQRARATEFAAQASVALQVAQARSDRERLDRAEDRARIARDLHDHVIQRLFAAGLALQAQADLPRASEAEILAQVDAIDESISEIRTIVFALTSGRGRGPSLRHRVLDAVGELSSGLRTPPRLTFTGAVDLTVPPELVDDVVAAVRESVANVARHADADHATVEVSVDGEAVEVRVIDDGVGFVPGSRASGTANLAARAAALGGEFDIRAGAESGTVVTWRVPLERSAT